jgi:hypothetical protein
MFTGDRFGGLPVPGRNDPLQILRGEIVSEDQRRGCSCGFRCSVQCKSITRMPDPDLVSIDAVPV